MTRSVLTFLVLFLGTIAAPRAGAAVVTLRARDTISAVELDHGDIVRFQLRSGAWRQIELLETGAEVVLTNLKQLKKGQRDGGLVYAMTCRLRVDGHELNLRRFVGCQESFYEPLVINGLRLWFDGVLAAEQVVAFTHGDCRPTKHARFALQDMTERVCPDELLPWYPDAEPYLSIANSYMGADCWMGPLFGAFAHGGLDINMPAGTPVLAPLGFDDHFLFTRIETGENNNRWRGLHRWPNGDLWMFQVHHPLTLDRPEHQPIRAGEAFALAAGVRVGLVEHSHYNFKLTPAGTDTVIDLDPWILLWQTFEDMKKRRGGIRAVMDPLVPAKTGIPVTFRSRGSLARASARQAALRFTWAFGDGSVSREENPTHTFARPGIYPVTLVVNDGGSRATVTQHITVDGGGLDRPALAITSDDAVAFRNRPVAAMDVYGSPVATLPHRLGFVARASRPSPEPQQLRLVNRSAGVLPKTRAEIRYEGKPGWATVVIEGEGNAQTATISVDGTGLPGGLYLAEASFTSEDAIDGTQTVEIEMRIPFHPPVHGMLDTARGGEPEGNTLCVRVDDAESARGFYATPWFWVGHRFALWSGPRGYAGFSLTNGGRSKPGEFVRFTPDLKAGSYEVAFDPATPFADGTRFAVRIHSAEGDETRWIEPSRSRTIGTFSFHEGTDGFVQLLADGAEGPVVADCVTFTPVAEPAGVKRQ